MPPLHVAFNATFLVPGVSGGPESYTRGLIPAVAAARPDAQITVLTSPSGAQSFRDAGWTSFATIVALPGESGQRVRRLGTEFVSIPLWARRHRPSVVHSLSNLGPISQMVAPHVLTLHDLTFMRLQTFGLLSTLSITKTALASARAATRIVTATEASRQELVELGDLDASVIDIVPHGRRPVVPARPEVIDAVRERFGLAGKRLLLNVAAKRPHKNQELLIRAMQHLPEDVVLLLAGHREPYADDLGALTTELGLGERVIEPSYVENEELEALWAIADVAAFPTKGEGFGLPVIEALDRGLPVASSNIPVLLEIAGGLTHPFDPEDPQDAATAILAALAEPAGREPARRAHASQFTWARAAELQWESYERAIAARSR